MGIEDRLRRLEGGECVVCNWGSQTALRVEWGHDLDEEAAEEPEMCPVCGGPGTVVIRWPEDIYPE